MSRSAASAATRTRTAHPRPGARSVAPAGPRRVSGPVRRPPGRAAAPAPVRRPTTTAFDHVRALPDHPLLDRLLRSQAWIWILGLGLGGIVAMQVSLLKLNSGISRAVEATSTLERQNATLEASVARLSSGQRIEDAAQSTGMVMPPAGSVRYVRPRPGTDARWAITRMRPPSPEARALMANGGIVPGSLIEPGGAGAPSAAPTSTSAPAPAPAPAAAATTPTPAPSTTAATPEG